MEYVLIFFGVFLVGAFFVVMAEKSKSPEQKAAQREKLLKQAEEAAQRKLDNIPKCPKCGERNNSYLQAITINEKAGFGSVNQTYNVEICKTCNVEYMPRKLLR